MPTETLAASLLAAPRRWWPEALLAVLAGAVFLGCLGSVELWGKREQRASAEAIDTVDHNHWLVAQIQGRPRLEKPPLPRWSIAALMMLTGRRDEWVVRLPGALAGVATVALIFILGRRMGGRALGLASAFVLCSMGFFVGEMRQASNDGLLVLFATLALYAAYRRLHDEEPNHARLARPGPERTRARVWNLVFHTALGLGFLTKGPVILLLVGVTLVPYLAFARRLTWGLRRLCDGWGLVDLRLAGPGWPAAVLVDDPGALRVWSLEMSEKTGLSHILEHRWHSPLVGQWPGLVLPWTLIAAVAVLLPLLSAIAGSRRDRAGARGFPSAGASGSDSVWFAWWWAVGNLVGVLYVGGRQAELLHSLPARHGLADRRDLVAAGAGGPRPGQGRPGGAGDLASPMGLDVRRGGGGPARGSRVAAGVALALVCGDRGWPWPPRSLLSVYAWRRGADALPLAPIAAACVFGVLIAYGIIAPAENELRSHRVLAQELHRLVPSQVRTLKFFNEIDEGLWFYLSGIDLAPVPGTHPRYNTAYDLAHSYLTERLPSETISHLEARRQARDKQALIDWIDHSEPSTSYLADPRQSLRRIRRRSGRPCRPALPRDGHETQRARPPSGGRPPSLTATASSAPPTRR